MSIFKYGIGTTFFICKETLELWERKKMCEARVWNKLYTEGIELDDRNHRCYITIAGERSDYEIFRVIILIRGIETIQEVAEKFKKGFEILESYRNCDCSAKVGECFRHLNKLELELPELAGQSTTT